ncbi:unnamed protein product [Orchesella dallaii]|uniref:peptidyl-tRNA hydrolase n=1 Tax=Orchesella dallaii TaxID=48710 RepID=A0ABP1QFN2_9HEXA
MSGGFERGVGDGQEQPYLGAGAAGGVDMNAPSSKEMVESLVTMGISRPEAELAVRQTGAETAEAAIAWVFENREQGDMLDAGAAGDAMFQDYKMVFVVNASLNMSPGKMAAQVGHGAIALYQDLVTRQDVYGGPLLQWNECGSKKIVLQCENASEFEQLTVKAEKSGLPCTTIEDAGLTQIPAGSRTVLAVFGLVNDVDAVTGNLRLY